MSFRNRLLRRKQRSPKVQPVSQVQPVQQVIRGAPTNPVKRKKLLLDSPLVSIVMPYYNRKEQTLATLETINQSAYKKIEVIIADDGSSEEQRMRLEDVDHLDLPIRIYYCEPKQKTWMNPCVAFNVAISHSLGDVIMLQSPECLHCTDLITHAVQNSEPDTYISYACYGIHNENICSKIRSAIFAKQVGPNFYDQFITLRITGQNPVQDKESCWFNHVKYQHRQYNFVSAIPRNMLMQIKGFDETYAHGVAYDDDDLLFRIKSAQATILSTNEQFYCIHQNHERLSDSQFEEVSQKNKLLFLQRNANARSEVLYGQYLSRFVKSDV